MMTVLLARPRLAALAVAVAYFLAARLGLTMAFVVEQVTLVWPPTGIALAAVLLLGRGVWPGVWVGAFLANAMAHEPTLVAAAIATGNTLEAVTGAWLLRRFTDIDTTLERPADVLGLVALGAVVSTMVSATIGVTSLCVGRVQPWSAYVSLWYVWWLGDAMGDLLVGSVLLTRRAWARHRRPRDFVEAGIMMAGVMVVSAGVFAGQFNTAGPYQQPLGYTVFPFVVWAALRFGHAETSLVSLVVSGIAIWGTVHGFGPFARSGQSVNESLIMLQIFMAVMSATGLLLGAAIARHKQAEVEVAESEARKAGILEAALDSIITIDQEGRIIEFNAAAERTFGYHRSKVIGRELAELIIPPALRNRYRRRLARYLATGKATFLGRHLDMTAVRADGAKRSVEISIVPLGSTPAPLFTVFLRDVTERRRLEKQLVFRASHDGLTRILNRASFMERLRAAMNRGRDESRGIAVLFMDIDRFNVINDNYGHLIGDQLLAAVAGRLQAGLRPGDTVARLGGDEFAVAASVKNTDEATLIADRIQKALERPFNVSGHELVTTISIGIALGTGDERPENLLRDADTALYDVKALGRAGYQVFDRAIHARATARLDLEAALRRALQCKEFVIHYQPIVSLATRKTVCLEALLRWQHPRQGLVAPAAFIALAEETGLIVPMGTWVLHTACAHAKAWQTNGSGPPVAINLSARQFQQPHLRDTVQEALTDSGLNPSSLELEITESLAMQDVEATVGTLRELSATGIGISIDDFGTGYSSLSCLKNFPIRTLKIDQSFVRNMTTHTDDAAIVAATIAMAHGLRLTVVAEGVETQEQLALLRAQRCDAVQGYRLSPPLPVEAVTRKLWEEARFQ